MGQRVLVVDDSMPVRQQVKFCLERAGFDITEAKDGQEAIDILENDMDFALILSDINMPKVDGLELVKAAVAMGFKNPICMLTTEDGIQMINSAKQAGAKAFFIKPFAPADLIKTAQKLTSV